METWVWWLVLPVWERMEEDGGRKAMIGRRMSETEKSRDWSRHARHLFYSYSKVSKVSKVF